MGDLEEVLVPLAAFWLVFMIIKYSLDFKLRKKLIEKGLVDEKVRYLWRYQNGVMSSLKWGMVLVAVGLGFLAYKIAPDAYWRDGEPEVFTFGVMLLLAGIALIVYHIIAPRISKSHEDNELTHRSDQS